MDPIPAEALLSPLDWKTPSDATSPHWRGLQMWRLRTDVSSDREQQLRGLLSPGERRRADRFVSSRHRTQCVATRGTLRLLLGRVLAVRPCSLRFIYTNWGKPSLRDFEQLFFSVSHSDDLALIGLSHGRPLGVDLERVRSDDRHQSWARSALAPAEIMRLDALPECERGSGFYRYWTLKEAYLKARGDGLSFPLGEFEVALGADDPPKLVANRRDPGDVDRWAFRELEVGVGFAAAVAISRAPLQIARALATSPKTSATSVCPPPSPDTAKEWMEGVCDPDSLRLTVDELQTHDFLDFVDTKRYSERLHDARDRSGIDEAFIGGEAMIAGRPILIGAYEFDFIGGGMGCVVGERIARLFEAAAQRGLPVVIGHRSGGARMQEGTRSLFQMARVCGAIAAYRCNGGLFVSVLRDPTMGGAFASSGTLGDVILAESHAQIGFAGARVVWETIGAELPADLQRSERLFESGFVDRVFERHELPVLLRQLLSATPSFEQHPVRRECSSARLESVQMPDKVELEARMETVRRARRYRRPRFDSWIEMLVEGFFELHGDRHEEDDAALRGGLARLRGQPIMVIGIDRGENLDSVRRRNGGMAAPSGYRKATRLVQLASRMGIPIVTLIDTPGADPSSVSERSGQGFAIGETLAAFMQAPVPTAALVFGEGGSGGAMALAAVNHLVMLENAHLSVISPEGCAAILWRNRRFAAEAAEAMQSTSRDLLQAGLVDEVIPEGPESALISTRLAESVLDSLEKALVTLGSRTAAELRDLRQRRVAFVGP